MKTIPLLLAILLALTPLAFGTKPMQTRVEGDVNIQTTESLLLELKPGSSIYTEVSQGQEITLATSRQKQTYFVSSITEESVNLLVGGDAYYGIEAKKQVELFDSVYVMLLGTQKSPYSGTLSATLVFSSKEKTTSGEVGGLYQNDPKYDLYGTIQSEQTMTYQVLGNTYKIQGIVKGDDFYFEVNGMSTGSLDVNKPYTFRDGTVIVALGVHLVGDAVVCEDGDDCSKGDGLISFALKAGKGSIVVEPTDPLAGRYDIQETLVSGNTGRYVIRGNAYEITAYIGRGMVSFTYLNENTGAVALNSRYTFQDGSVIVPLKIASTESPPCLGNCPPTPQIVTFGFIAGKGKPVVTPQPPTTRFDIQETLANGKTGRYTIRGNVYEITAYAEDDDAGFSYNGEFTYTLDINKKYQFKDGSVIVPLRITEEKQQVQCVTTPCNPIIVYSVEFGFNAGRGLTPEPVEPKPLFPPMQVGKSFTLKIGEIAPINPPQAGSNVVIRLEAVDPEFKKVTMNWGTGVVSFNGRTQLGSGVFLVVDRLDIYGGVFHWETQVYDNTLYGKGLRTSKNIAVLNVVVDAFSGDLKAMLVNNGDNGIDAGSIPYFATDMYSEKSGYIEMQSWPVGEIRTIYLERVVDPDKYTYPTITGVMFVINPEGKLPTYTDGPAEYEQRIDDNGYAYIYYNKHYSSTVVEPTPIGEEHLIELDANKPTRIVTEIAMNPVIVVRFKDGNKQINVPIKVIDFETASGFAAIGNPKVYTKLYEGQSETGALGLAFEKAAVKLTLVDVTGSKGREAVIALEVVTKRTEPPVVTTNQNDLESLKQELLKLKQDLKETKADLEKTKGDVEETRSWVKKLWDFVFGWAK